MDANKDQTSQVQHDWMKAGADLAAAGLERAKGFYEQWAELEAGSVEQMQAALQESHRLVGESLAYGRRLTAAMRKASLEAVERAAALVKTGT